MSGLNSSVGGTAAPTADQSKAIIGDSTTQESQQGSVPVSAPSSASASATAQTGHEQTATTTTTQVPTRLDTPLSPSNNGPQANTVLPLTGESHAAASATVHPATKLRRIIESPNGFVFAPGVHDGLSARVALEAGFEFLYMTGAGTAASRLGMPDIGLTGLYDMRANAEMLANLVPGIPLIADMDTGYGGPANITRSVSEYVRANVAAFHIEDQIQQKRCGHLSHKRLVSPEVFQSRIRAAVAARKALNSDILIIARTDALSASTPGDAGEDQSYGAALQRLKIARDAGADMAFLEGVDSVENMKQLISDVAPWPVLLNMVEHGRTPTISVQQAREIGFKMVIWPFAGMSPAICAMRTAYKELRDTGLANNVPRVTPKDVFELCGLNEWMDIDTAAGGEDFKHGA